MPTTKVLDINALGDIQDLSEYPSFLISFTYQLHQHRAWVLHKIL